MQYVYKKLRFNKNIIIHPCLAYKVRVASPLSTFQEVEAFKFAGLKDSYFRPKPKPTMDTVESPKGKKKDKKDKKKGKKDKKGKKGKKNLDDDALNLKYVSYYNFVVASFLYIIFSCCQKSLNLNQRLNLV